jgi:hypothetical protein
MGRLLTTRRGHAWLELCLALAAVVLLIQVIITFPSHSQAVMRRVSEVIDFRNWSQLTWFLLNLLIVVGLLAVRFANELREAIGHWNRSLFGRGKGSRSSDLSDGLDPDHASRVQKQREWVERAKKRLPFT